jgi:hypothetical protein
VLGGPFFFFFTGVSLIEAARNLALKVGRMQGPSQQQISGWKGTRSNSTTIVSWSCFAKSWETNWRQSHAVISEINLNIF